LTLSSVACIGLVAFRNICGKRLVILTFKTRVFIMKKFTLISLLSASAIVLTMNVASAATATGVSSVYGSLAIEQVGNANDSKISMVGLRDHTNVSVTGDANSTNITQVGSRDRAKLAIVGGKNAAKIVQRGDLNRANIKSTGDFNSVNTRQVGSRNGISVIQTGGYLTTEIEQIGSNDTAIVRVGEIASSANDITTVSQTGGDFNTAIVRNDGVGNNVAVAQAGSNNYVNAALNNNSASLSATQTGSNNIANVSLRTH
jgi:hypothetical protein